MCVAALYPPVHYVTKGGEIVPDHVVCVYSLDMNDFFSPQISMDLFI